MRKALITDDMTPHLAAKARSYGLLPEITDVLLIGAMFNGVAADENGARPLKIQDRHYVLHASEILRNMVIVCLRIQTSV